MYVNEYYDYKFCTYVNLFLLPNICTVRCSYYQPLFIFFGFFSSLNWRVSTNLKNIYI